MSNKDINILIVALHYYDNEEEMLLKICKNGVSAAHHVLLNNLIDGLKEYANVTILSSLPIGSFPQMSHKVLVKSKYQEHGYEIGYVNIPFAKDKIRECIAQREIVRWYENLQTKENSYVIIYDAIQPFIAAAIKAKKRINTITNVIMLPDLPGRFSVENKTYNKIVNYRLNRKAISFYKNVKMLDAIIPLTKHMMSAIDAEDKPYLVIECIVDEMNLEIPAISNNPQRRLMYAGELSPKVNIENLIEAVKQVDSCELIICGRGPMEKYIISETQKSDKIKYYGFIPKKDIKDIEKGIDIFVNPRQETEEYTKYSFPSKNAEYLLTGKPVIAYMLSGIPEEYSEHIRSPKDNSVKALANTIEEIANEDSIVLNEKAKKQMEFMKNKSSKVQGKKIIEFLSSLH